MLNPQTFKIKIGRYFPITLYFAAIFLSYLWYILSDIYIGNFRLRFWLFLVIFGVDFARCVYISKNLDIHIPKFLMYFAALFCLIYGCFCPIYTCSSRLSQHCPQSPPICNVGVENIHSAGFTQCQYFLT